MDDLISILIVDDNVEFCNVLNEYLNQCGGMIVKGIARDGIEAINMIKELAPGIVILDLIMPNLDGIGVLERISEIQLKRRPIFIVLTAIGQNIFVQKAIELGAEYYILKPFDVNILVSRIRQIYSEKVAIQRKNMDMNGAAEVLETERNNLEQVITGLIKNMGITPNITGFRYLREAVILSVGNPSVLNSVKKYIYSSIANKHNTKERNVDRAIRGAIKSASEKVYNNEVGNRNVIIDHSRKNKPTNVQVITILANKARLEMELY